MYHFTCLFYFIWIKGPLLIYHVKNLINLGIYFSKLGNFFSFNWEFFVNLKEILIGNGAHIRPQIWPRKITGIKLCICNKGKLEISEYILLQLVLYIVKTLISLKISIFSPIFAAVLLICYKWTKSLLIKQTYFWYINPKGKTIQISSKLRRSEFKSRSL